ncbi:MAG: IS5 family transposase [Acidimicrobiales bacterium]|nr:IS5 family transposase [Acidimicrobiales bacterium]MYG87040.1 IS5 family transposase [Acidimicrobiales bacterium]MYI27002.1 IS5 family transposase [Acidimicrobiales bacterium]
MRALTKAVVDVIWAAVEPLLPRAPDRHPLGCHRRRVCDWLCLRGIIIRLVTGCSWQSVEYLLDGEVSDTTLRSRRDEWEAAGVFDKIAAEAIAAYDRIMGLRLADVCIDGSIHKAPGGGPGTGKSPVDRRKLGWKTSIATEAAGIPIGWAADGANRNDIMLFGPTIAQVVERGLHHDIDTMHLDRGYIGACVDTAAAGAGIADIRRPAKRPPGQPAEPAPAPLGLRWRVERTNSWLSNYGQIRRNTDRKPHHRLAQLALAIALIITVKLIDHRDRWQPRPAPIR